MAERLSRSAPYEITSIDIHSINDVFRQIQQAIDELKGLSGALTVHSAVTFDSSAYATTAQIANVAATESAGTSTKIPRGDHVHAHGTGYLPNAHHNQAHAIGGSDHTGNLDASAITFTPSTLSDWTGSADPGQTDDALDQLAGRTTTLESGGSTATTDTNNVDADSTTELWEQILPGTEIDVVVEGESSSAIRPQLNHELAEIDASQTQLSWESTIEGLAELGYAVDSTNRWHQQGLNRFRYLNIIGQFSMSGDSSLITSGTPTAVAFDVEEVDTASLHDNATNNTRITVPIDGKYIVCANTGWTANATGRRGLLLRKNGTTYLGVGQYIDATGTAETVAAASWIVSLAASDYIEIMAQQDSGGDLALHGDSTFQSFTSASIAYVGE